MAGIKPLRKIQLGRETTAGTAVNATTIFRAQGVLENQDEYVWPEEHVGFISGVDRVYVPKKFGALSMPSFPATFEQILHILEAGVKAITTGTADGAGSGKIYTYTFPTTAKNTIKTYTIETGDDQEAEEMEYGFVESFVMEGKGGEAWMVGSEWRGRQVVNSTFTSALSLVTVEEMLFSKTKLYVDTTGGTIGTTQKSNTLLGAKLDVTTGWVPKWTADGATTFSFAKLTEPKVTLELTYEHDGTATAEKAAWRAGTPRLIQLLVTGNALTTAGTSYSNKTVAINLAGKYEKFNALEEEDGNDIVTCTFVARYNSTSTKFAEVIVVNEVASVP